MVITKKYGAISAIDTTVAVIVVVRGQRMETVMDRYRAKSASVRLKCAQEVCYYCWTHKRLIQQKADCIALNSFF